MDYIYVVLMGALPILVIGIDQFIKYIVMKRWMRREYSEGKGGRVALRLVKNTGGFLGFAKMRSKGFFVAIFIAALVVILWMIFSEILVGGIRSPQIYPLIALLAGGISNTVDRIRYGGVLDYWQIAIGKKHIIINFADVVIFAGGITYLILSFSRS